MQKFLGLHVDAMWKNTVTGKDLFLKPKVKSTVVIGEAMVMHTRKLCHLVDTPIYVQNKWRCNNLMMHTQSACFKSSCTGPSNMIPHGTYMVINHSSAWIFGSVHQCIYTL